MDLRGGRLVQSADLAWSRVAERMPEVRNALSLLRTPRPSWVTFVLLFLTLFIVDASVEAADWVDTPSLVAVTFWSMLTAVLLAQRRAYPLLLHAAGLLVGAVVVLIFATALVEAPRDRGTSLEELFLRVGAWLDAAFGGGISSDTMPFGLTLIAAAWLIGYVSTWFVFRMASIWGGIVPGALGILTNLSYLPDRFFIFFFLYILVALLLVVWMYGLSRGEEWRRRGVAHSWRVNLLSLMNAFWLGVVIIIVAALLPLRTAVAEPLRKAYNQVHSPVEMVQEHFTRLFSGVPGYKDTGIRIFGSALPFQGPISLTELIVFTARSQYPTYWAARSYDTYTSQGWPEAKSEEHPWGWEPQGSQPVSYRSLLEVQQELLLNVDTSTLFYGGTPEVLDREATLVVPRMQVYTVDLQDSSGYGMLPPDLHQWAEDLRQVWIGNQGELGFQQALAPLLLSQFPDDTLLVEAELKTEDDRAKRLLFLLEEEASSSGVPRLGAAERLLRAQGRLTSLSVTRAQPAPPDLLALQASRRMSAGTPYSLLGSISAATEEELLQASTLYPKWVTDRYLQLPDTLPQRDRQLAQEITRGAATPYEKALRVTNYLRQNYEYSTTIEPPPYNADGVDYFLFVQKQGYSDYFASAMAILMREVNVPTRMVAGYGMGTWEPNQEILVIRDRDSHVWPEVFFPGYGWVIFEPTPIYQPPLRGVPLPLREEALPEETESELSCEGLTFEECEDLLSGAITEVPPVEGIEETVGGRNLTSVILMLGLLVAGVAFVGYVVWQRGTRALGNPERAYEQMRVLANLAHLGPQPSQTPYEFGRDLGTRLSSVRRYVNFICDAYVRMKYGRQEILPQDRITLDEAWRQVRGQVIRRVLHLGGG